MGMEHVQTWIRFYNFLSLIATNIHVPNLNLERSDLAAHNGVLLIPRRPQPAYAFPLVDSDIRTEP
jgi:hypothetical protein